MFQSLNFELAYLSFDSNYARMVTVFNNSVIHGVLYILRNGSAWLCCEILRLLIMLMKKSLTI